MIYHDHSYKYGKYHPDSRYNNDKCYYCTISNNHIIRGLCRNCRQDKFLLIDKNDAIRKYYLTDKEIDDADLFVYMNKKYIIDEIEDLAKKIHSLENNDADKRRHDKYWDKQNYVSRNEKLEHFIRDNILEQDYRKYIRGSKMYKKIRADENISFVRAVDEIMIKYRRKSAKDYEIKTRTRELEEVLCKNFDEHDILTYIRDFYEYEYYINLDDNQKCMDDLIKEIKEKLDKIKKS